MALELEAGAASVELARRLEDGSSEVVVATSASNPAELSNISLRHRGAVSEPTEFYVTASSRNPSRIKAGNLHFGFKVYRPGYQFNYERPTASCFDL